MTHETARHSSRLHRLVLRSRHSCLLLRPLLGPATAQLLAMPRISRRLKIIIKKMNLGCRRPQSFHFIWPGALSSTALVQSSLNFLVAARQARCKPRVIWHGACAPTTRTNSGDGYADAVIIFLHASHDCCFSSSSADWHWRGCSPIANYRASAKGDCDDRHAVTSWRASL